MYEIQKNMDKVDLKQMRIFLLLVREENVSKVADEVGLSQQAVSSHLKKLREAFPHELFLRQSSGLKPTDFALELATKFSQILADVDDVFNEVPFEPCSAQRVATIIANEYAQLVLIPKLFGEIQRSAPGVRLRVVDFDVKSHEVSLAKANADLVLGFSEYVDDGLIKLPIKSELYSCVVGRNSKIYSSIKDVSDLANFPHVDFASGAGHLPHSVDFFLKQKNVMREVVATLPCYTSLGTFFDTNDVVAFVPSAIAVSSQLKTISFDTEPQKFEVVAGWHRRSHGNSFRKWLTGIAVKSAD
jgi:DNA-binding transcriptional LysR family regulator